MARKWWRALATVGLVVATSTGVVVSSGGGAQAYVPSPSEKLVVQTIAEGFMKGGVRAAGPGVAARAEGRCLASGPGTAPCLMVTTAGVLLITGGYLTRDLWVPWLMEKIEPTPEESGEGTWQDGHFLQTITTKPTESNTKAILYAKQYSTAGYASPQAGMANSNCRRSNGSTYMALKIAIWPATEAGPWGPWAGKTEGPSTGWRANHVGTNGTAQNWVNGAPGAPADTYNGLCNEGDTLVGTTLYKGDNLSPPMYTWGAPPVQQPSTTTSRTTCRRADGTQYEVNRSSEPVDGQVLVAACDPGDTPIGLGLKERKADGTEVDGGNLDLRPDPTDDMKYPQCAGQACVYRVFVDGNPCQNGVEDCTHWSELSRSAPDRVECYWGPYKIATSGCAFMERAFDDQADARQVTKRNTDGNPDTYDPPAPKPRTSPSPSPSPTSTASPTVTNPSPTPSTTAKSPAQRCLDGDPSCSPVRDPNTPESQQNECWPNGWGAVNPANWVLQPTKCALKWAFVPPPGTFTGVRTSVGESWDGSTPGQWFGALPGFWSGTVGSINAGGCQGPGVPTGFIGRQTSLPGTIYPFSACEYPVSKAAEVARAVSGLAISFFGGLRCVGVLGSAFGWVPPVAYSYRDYSETGHGWR